MLNLCTKEIFKKLIFAYIGKKQNKVRTNEKSYLIRMVTCGGELEKEWKSRDKSDIWHEFMCSIVLNFKTCKYLHVPKFKT